METHDTRRLMPELPSPRREPVDLYQVLSEALEVSRRLEALLPPLEEPGEAMNESSSTCHTESSNDTAASRRKGHDKQ